MSMVAYFSFWCPFNNPHEAIVSNLDSWSSCGPRLFQLESVGEESQCQACVGTMGILHNESETENVKLHISSLVLSRFAAALPSSARPERGA